VSSTSLAGRTILIVEDEPLIALDVGIAFENAGAVLLSARSLAQAQRLVEHDDLSAAVMDFALSDGYADPICARLEARAIPYVLHSGYSERIAVHRQGAVIPKPAHPRALVEAIIALVRNSNVKSSSTLQPRDVIQSA
jgi:DNA-binding response OmpR family regulator